MGWMVAALAVILVGNGLILADLRRAARRDIWDAYARVRRAMAAAFVAAAPGDAWDEGELRRAAWTRIQARYPEATYAEFWRACWAPVRAVGWQEGRWQSLAPWTEKEVSE